MRVSHYWIAKSSESSASFDHSKDGYVRDSWEDVFSSCDELVGKLLDDHLLIEGSRLGEVVPGK